MVAFRDFGVLIVFYGAEFIGELDIGLSNNGAGCFAAFFGGVLYVGGLLRSKTSSNTCLYVLRESGSSVGCVCSAFVCFFHAFLREASLAIW